MSKESTPLQQQEHGRKQPNYLKRKIGAGLLTVLVSLGAWKVTELAREATNKIGDALEVTDVGCVYEPVYPGDNNIDPVDRAVARLQAEHPEFDPPQKRRIVAADGLYVVEGGTEIEVCGYNDNVPDPLGRLPLLGDDLTASRP